MTSFEKFLIENNYNKYVMNYRTFLFTHVSNHQLSTSGNLEHYYVHKKHMLIDGSFKPNIPIITFGLSEVHKKPTLISPRPIINVTRINETSSIIQNEFYDNSVNLVLMNEKPELILASLWDKRITFNYTVKFIKL
jgi:hypothetical protein